MTDIVVKNVVLKERHKLCMDLYKAGMKRDGSEVKRVLKKLREVDKKIDVPKFDLPTELPQVGDKVYLPTRGSISHGYDDVRGGVGVVMKIEEGISGGEQCFWVTAHEHPGRGYNWEFLAQEQEDLQTMYGDAWARPDPDLHVYEESW